MKDCLVILNAPSSLEEAVVDCLLTLESEHGFSSFPVNVHHHENKGLSLAEQVSGRQKQVCFQIHIDEDGTGLLLKRLKEEFSGAGIQYWVLPVLESSEI
ncbi:DUF3240 family protein [Methyloglobulus sp.]|uniref:DUF3240 family protein n=1 Tax=Methyloglobulus sp. TaxID=2518622 RepID=UPI0039892725